MKKLFLMMAVALPLLFTSCSNDDDDKNDFTVPLLVKSGANVNVSNSFVSLEWYEDKEDVIEAMIPFSYVLDSSSSNASVLVYEYNDSEGFPLYSYGFGSSNKLASVSITMTDPQDNNSNLTDYLDEHYNDVTPDDEDTKIIWENDVCTVTFVPDYSVSALPVMRYIWTPKSTRASFEDVVAMHREATKAIIESKANNTK